jgi:hemoglobin-like flavoprotein
MQYALTQLNTMELGDFQVELKSGIGINFGRTYVGHLGHPNHKQFSVVGDPVNIASRIQQQTKKTGAKILISTPVLKGISTDNLLIGRTYQAKLTEGDQQTELYELLGFREMDLQLELQSSLHVMLEDQDKFAEAFYNRVFNIAPDVKNLFKKNITDQGRLLTHMLGGIVYSLSRPEYLELGLKKLGESHNKYGVEPEHYPVVKQAMMETIEESLGDLKTDKTMRAWSAALDKVVDVMQKWNQ